MTISAGRLRLRFGYPAAAALCACAVLYAERFLPALLCVLLHEGGHIAALLAFGEHEIEVVLRVLSVDIIDKGAASRPDRRQAIVALAGPLSNGVTSLLFFAAYKVCGIQLFQSCALIGVCIGGFNLLPMIATDGGALAAIALQRRFSERTANAILTALTLLLMFPVCAAAFLAMLRSGRNFTLLAFAAAGIASLIDAKTG